MAPFRPLLDLMLRQHRLAKLDQLATFGLTPDAVRHLVRTERLWRVYREVYALPGPLTEEGRSLAAVFRCDPDAYASRFSAAAVLGLRDHWPERPQVTILGEWVRGPEAIDTKRARRLDVGTCQGIPVTSPAQTIIDCAPHLDERGLKAMLRRAEYDGLDLAVLDAKGLPANLTALLDRYVTGSGLTESEIEARLFELCAAAGLPRPEVQHRTGNRRIDFVWREHGVIVETDGRRAHDSFVAFADDRARDREHLLAGHVTLRFTWWEVEHAPELVIAQVRAVLGRVR